MAEWVVPGLGYGLNGDFDKALIIGGSRWVAQGHYFDLIEHPDYQEDYTTTYDISETNDTESGKYEYRFYLNKQTHQARFYGSLSNNLLLTTWGDLYLSGCQSNRDVYRYASAPLRVDLWYDDLWFWVPMAALAVSLPSLGEDTLIEYHLGNGLTKDELYRDSWKQYYMVGLGEEMFFRGLVQQGFYDTFSGSWGWNGQVARHASVFTSALVFGAAHTGEGITASNYAAFGAGVYFGYAYMPEPGRTEMERVIAVHAWWDILIAYAYLNNAEFFEEEEAVEVPLAAVSFRF